jgi:hypothetical protein
MRNFESRLTKRLKPLWKILSKVIIEAIWGTFAG